MVTLNLRAIVSENITPLEWSRPSQWAEKYRFLSRRSSARPGRWRNHNAPYLAGIMDMCLRKNVQEINIMKAAQVGVSEAIRNVLGWMACYQPDPVLLQLPDALLGRKIVSRRIVPLFEGTPVLKKKISKRRRDTQQRYIMLNNGFTLSLGYSGSPASLSADPARVVINDEVDKFVIWSGREADPISLAEMRTQTYENNRIIFNVSTPTTRDGIIASKFEGSDYQLFFYVPCPACGEYQRLVFDGLKYEHHNLEDNKLGAAKIIQSKSAWYECVHCKGVINDFQKQEILQRGRWASSTQQITKEGEIVGDCPAGRSVGMHVSALYCTWIKFYEIAAEWIKSQNDLRKLMNFRNSWLGEPFEEQVDKISRSVVQTRVDPNIPEKIVPEWAQVLLATIDVQKDCFYWVVRAWGYAYKSQRIDHGICRSWNELEAMFITGGYARHDKSLARVRLIGIDAGYRTEEVYRWSLKCPGMIKVIKGEGKKRSSTSKPLKVFRTTYNPPGDKVHRLHVWLHILITDFYKDWLAARINAKINRINETTGEEMSEPVWLLDSADDPEYNRQMASEHKVIIRHGRGEPEMRWVPISKGAQNHFWDCEVYQMAMADIARIDLLPAEPRKQTPQGNALSVSNEPTNNRYRRGSIRRKYG